MTLRTVNARDARPLRLGTRRSALAHVQAELVAARLPRQVTVVPIAVGADADRRPLEAQAGTRAFTGSIERCLLAGDIDLAVHSLKDLPVAPIAGLRVAARLPRGPVGDLLLRRGSDADAPLGLPAGARVGTGSARRAALLSLHAPQARAVPIRGNVPTRIEHCARGRVGSGGVGAGRRRAARLRGRRTVGGAAARAARPPDWLPASGTGRDRGAGA